MARETDGLTCPAGCVPCGNTYWSNGHVHYSGCCKSRQCGGTSNEALRRTDAYIKKLRQQGKSVEATGVLKTFIEAEAKKADPLKAWLGDNFDQDVAEWLRVENETVTAWLRAEEGFKSAVGKWLIEEQTWQAMVTKWLDAEAEVKAQEQQAAQAEDTLLEELRAKAEATKKERVVLRVREEAAPQRAHTTARLEALRGKH